MIFSDHLRFVCILCSNGHRHNTCTHFSRISNGEVFVLEDRGRTRKTHRGIVDQKDRITLLHAELIDDEKLNPLCTITGLPSCLCERQKCRYCRKMKTCNAFIKTKGMVLGLKDAGPENYEMYANLESLTEVASIFPFSVHYMQQCGISYINQVSARNLDSDVILALNAYLREHFKDKEMSSDYNSSDIGVNPFYASVKINPFLVTFLKAKIQIDRKLKDKIIPRKIRDMVNTIVQDKGNHLWYNKHSGGIRVYDYKEEDGFPGIADILAWQTKVERFVDKLTAGNLSISSTEDLIATVSETFCNSTGHTLLDQFSNRPQHNMRTESLTERKDVQEAVRVAKTVNHPAASPPFKRQINESLVNKGTKKKVFRPRRRFNSLPIRHTSIQFLPPSHEHTMYNTNSPEHQILSESDPGSPLKSLQFFDAFRSSTSTTNCSPKVSTSNGEFDLFQLLGMERSRNNIQKTKATQTAQDILRQGTTLSPLTLRIKQGGSISCTSVAFSETPGLDSILCDQSFTSSTSKQSYVLYDDAGNSLGSLSPSMPILPFSPMIDDDPLALRAQPSDEDPVEDRIDPAFAALIEDATVTLDDKVKSPAHICIRDMNENDQYDFSFGSENGDMDLLYEEMS